MLPEFFLSRWLPAFWVGMYQITQGLFITLWKDSEEELVGSVLTWGCADPFLSSYSEFWAFPIMILDTFLCLWAAGHLACLLTLSTICPLSKWHGVEGLALGPRGWWSESTWCPSFVCQLLMLSKYVLCVLVCEVFGCGAQMQKKVLYLRGLDLLGMQRTQTQLSENASRTWEKVRYLCISRGWGERDNRKFTLAKITIHGPHSTRISSCSLVAWWKFHCHLSF